MMNPSNFHPKVKKSKKVQSKPTVAEEIEAFEQSVNNKNCKYERKDYMLNGVTSAFVKIFNEGNCFA
jgi:hypothetical protein